MKIKERCPFCGGAAQEILNWINAYPLDLFPEPDLKKAAKVLKENGMTLDAISASNMRHVLDGIEKIIRANTRHRPGVTGWVDKQDFADYRKRPGGAVIVYNKDDKTIQDVQVRIVEETP